MLISRAVLTPKNEVLVFKTKTSFFGVLNNFGRLVVSVSTLLCLVLCLLLALHYRRGKFETYWLKDPKIYLLILFKNAMRCYYSDYLLSFLLRSVSVLVSNSLVMDMLLVLGFWSCSHHNLLVVTVFKERYYFCLGRSSNGIRLSSYCFFSNVLSVHVLYMYRLFSCPPCSYRMLAELSEISFE